MYSPTSSLHMNLSDSVISGPLSPPQPTTLRQNEAMRFFIRLDDKNFFNNLSLPSRAKSWIGPLYEIEVKSQAEAMRADYWKKECGRVQRELGQMQQRYLRKRPASIASNASTIPLPSKRARLDLGDAGMGPSALPSTSRGEEDRSEVPSPSPYPPPSAPRRPVPSTPASSNPPPRSPVRRWRPAVVPSVSYPGPPATAAEAEDRVQERWRRLAAKARLDQLYRTVKEACGGARFTRVLLDWRIKNLMGDWGDVELGVNLDQIPAEGSPEESLVVLRCVYARDLGL